MNATTVAPIHDLAQPSARGGAPAFVIDITRVSGRSLRRAFIGFPYTFYRRDPHWVPPLRWLEWERFNPRKNPFYEHAEVELFVAVRDGAVVGRIAAVEDRLHNETHQEALATFGCFEARDQAVAGSLLRAAEHWATRRGLRALRGPLHLSLNESAGLLVDGFDEDPMLLMPYNPPVYAEYLAACGYTKIKDLYAWILDRRDSLAERELALVERIRQRYGVSIRGIDMKRWQQELDRILDIYRQAWSGNWGFVPPTAREAQHTVDALRKLVDPRFILCADIQGRTVGFVVAVPDLNQVLKGTNGRLLRTLPRLLRRRRYMDQYRLLLLGVLPEYNGLGLYPLLITELYKRSHSVRWRRLEFSWVLEDNDYVNLMASKAGSRRYKTYRLFEKPLT